MPLLNKEYVYLLEEIEINSDNPTGLVKIGRTANDVKDRINQLKTGNPRKLRKFAAIQTEIGQSYAEEARQHKDYYKLKAPEGGGDEWFKDDTNIIKKLFKIDADKSLTADHNFDDYVDKYEEFSEGKYKNTFDFVNNEICQKLIDKHVCVLAPPKSGKRIMVQSLSLMMPYAYHFFITSLDRTDIKDQIKEFEKFKIETTVLTNSGKNNKTNDVKTTIKKQLDIGNEIVIHYDECDYGSDKNGMAGKFIADLAGEFDNGNLHFVVYSATPEEAIWSKADYHLAHFKPNDNYKGPDFFITNNLIEDPVPFFTNVSGSLVLTNKTKSILNDWSLSDKRYLVLRLNYLLDDDNSKKKTNSKNENSKRIRGLSAFSFANDNSRLQDAIDKHVKNNNIYVHFIDQNESFEWYFEDKSTGKNGSWSAYKDYKYIFVVNGTCTRSTEVGFHPDIYAWHDYRKKDKTLSTTYGTYAQAIGRVFHYLPDYKGRIKSFEYKDTKIKLFAEKELITVMSQIYSASSKKEMEKIWEDYREKNKPGCRKPGGRVNYSEKNKRASVKIHVFNSEKEAIEKTNSIIEEDLKRETPKLIKDKISKTRTGTLSKRNTFPDFIKHIVEKTLPSPQDINIKIDGPPPMMNPKITVLQKTAVINNYNNYISNNAEMLGKYIVFEPLDEIISDQDSKLITTKTLHDKI